jgi:hypothetical protein
MGRSVHPSARPHRSSDAKHEWDTLYIVSSASHLILHPNISKGLFKTSPLPKKPFGLRKQMGFFDSSIRSNIKIHPSLHVGWVAVLISPGLWTHWLPRHRSAVDWVRSTSASPKVMLTIVHGVEGLHIVDCFRKKWRLTLITVARISFLRFSEHARHPRTADWSIMLTRPGRIPRSAQENPWRQTSIVRH